MEDRMTEIHDRIAVAVEAIVTGQEWQQMLAVAGRFSAYSAHNVWLIMSANPHATKLMGYKSWQKLGRQVRAGERGIPILAPVVRRQAEVDEVVDSPEVVRILKGFRIVHTLTSRKRMGPTCPRSGRNC